MKYLDRVAGLILIVLVALIGIFFITSYTPLSKPLAPPLDVSPMQWFLTYRFFDVVFLCLLVFAAILGTSALFRPEEIVTVGEVAVTEGEATEEEEE